MLEQGNLRKQLVDYSRELFLHRQGVEGRGNLSVLMSDDTVLMTPNGLGHGKLRPQLLSLMSLEGRLISGEKPQWDVEYHLAIYRANPKYRAIVSMRSKHISKLADNESLNPENVLPAFAPFVAMRTPILPRVSVTDNNGVSNEFCMLAEKARQHHALLTTNAGLVVMGENLKDAMYNFEELEETAALRLQTPNENLQYLSNEEIAEINAVFAH
ncbi:ribulose phosphate epimerase [Enterovibrio norvegicus FF-33]|uniref:Ribulose phosphate epimerase n=1 Tax=Enterovibrio norvegicus FF-454 TaxID=1185651 RepID=A0A1E5BYD0_9GAMM|nr:class II aldolase/adducin family protein [Enterovibrio norvegicus]OEE58294.1 ribulose phosphate epimerase [Enterovibrio norvegicus FF-454]OEE67205.1 ribulose phosphate epimerase [Enterovibrio norvegicus FF-33]OEE86974.1 ribulose phosphate epimerase [Enterovibrio norvegicus FF-162]